ncbi:MAG: hypothetical protein CM15mV51_1600 [uncultured marine virus]|nr:MAG: hypothetical protein CM15mV51_1600 [uncultured marine virus]
MHLHHAFDANRIINFVQMMLIGWICVECDVWEVKCSFGDQKRELKLRVSQPANSKCSRSVVHLEYEFKQVNPILIPRITNWDNTPIYISVAPLDHKIQRVCNF